jgi:hypothetical protein
MPLLKVIVPGFGAPYVDVKTTILKWNLIHLQSHRPPNMAIEVNVHIYDDTPTPVLERLEGHMQERIWFGDITITFHRGRGIVGDFLYCHRHFDQGVDYVLVLLDDVELSPNFDLALAIDLVNEHKLDILSPALTNDSPTSYPYMRQTQSGDTEVEGGTKATPFVRHLRILSACELFCYLTTRSAFRTWTNHMQPWNPWLWGMDLLLHVRFGLRVGMPNFMTARHHFQGTAYAQHSKDPHSLGSDPHKAWADYMQYYKVDRAFLANMASTLEVLPA